VYAGRRGRHPQDAAPIKLAPPHIGPDRRKS
jgi:hypothetical protein